jgi:hypothetical protein
MPSVVLSLSSPLPSSSSSTSAFSPTSSSFPDATSVTGSLQSTSSFGAPFSSETGSYLTSAIVTTISGTVTTVRLLPRLRSVSAHISSTPDLFPNPHTSVRFRHVFELSSDHRDSEHRCWLFRVLHLGSLRRPPLQTISEEEAWSAPLPKATNRARDAFGWRRFRRFQRICPNHTQHLSLQRYLQHKQPLSFGRHPEFHRCRPGQSQHVFLGFFNVPHSRSFTRSHFTNWFHIS